MLLWVTKTQIRNVPEDPGGICLHIRVCGTPPEVPEAVPPGNYPINMCLAGPFWLAGGLLAKGQHHYWLVRIVPAILVFFPCNVLFSGGALEFIFVSFASTSKTCKSCICMVGDRDEGDKQSWPWLVVLAQEWLQWQLEQPDWAVQLQDDERFLTVLLVLRCINSVFRTLYSSGVWLPRDVALEVGRQGITALRGYAKLAKISMEMDEPRYPLYPKFHMLLHQFWWLVWRSEVSDWVESPMCDCCQMCEGFIGHISRYSRRVSPSSTVDRTIDLYLVALWRHWQDDQW